MGKYDDFDLDLNKISARNGEIEPDVATAGPVCTFISGIVVGSVVTGCSGDCMTKNCSVDCPVPSRDYNHRSCNKALIVANNQIMC